VKIRVVWDVTSFRHGVISQKSRILIKTAVRTLKKKSRLHNTLVLLVDSPICFGPTYWPSLGILLWHMQRMFQLIY